MQRKNISSGAKWEDIVGYSRAVIVGNMVHIAGTTSIDEHGKVVGKENPYEQTIHTFSIIKDALEQAGSTFENVVRTRMYVTDISRWEEYGKAHGEIFKNIKPASTMVEVSALVDPELMIEIEVDAYIS